VIVIALDRVHLVVRRGACSAQLAAWVRAARRLRLAAAANHAA
jgi:hypothetical protein